VEGPAQRMCRGRQVAPRPDRRDRPCVLRPKSHSHGASLAAPGFVPPRFVGAVSRAHHASTGRRNAHYKSHGAKRDREPLQDGTRLRGGGREPVSSTGPTFADGGRWPLDMTIPCLNRGRDPSATRKPCLAGSGPLFGTRPAISLKL